MHAHEQLIEILNSPQEEERIQALKNLFHQPSREDRELLYKALGDEGWRVRKEAVELFCLYYPEDEYIPEIIKLLYAPDNAGLRNAAVEILVTLGERAVPCLNQEMDSNDSDVRKFLLDIMGQIGSPRTLPVMIRALDDTDVNVRVAAAENLGKNRSAEAIPDLLEHLRDPDLLFRFTILSSLGQIGKAVPVEPLLAFRGDSLLRKALIDCLGQVGAIEALPFLVECLTDSLRNVQQAAAVALYRLSGRYASEILKYLENWDSERALETIELLFEQKSNDGRRAALFLSECLGERSFIPQIASFLEREGIHENALRALVSIGKKSPQPLVEFWRLSEGNVRAHLSLVMGQAQCQEAIPFLISDLETEEAERRGAAAQSLGQFACLPALKPLIQVLDDSDEEVSEAALLALTRICPQYPEEAFESLYPMLYDENPNRRMYAVRILGTLEYHPGVEKALVRSMKDESARVRMAAIRAGRLTVQSVRALKLALTDEDSGVRQEAVERLGEIAEPQVLDFMASALRDEDIWVRRAAVMALGRIGGGQAISLVREAVRDPIGLVTICALEVLAEIDPRQSRAFVTEALKNSDDQVVMTALRILCSSEDNEWLDESRDILLNHPSDEVKATFSRVLNDSAGSTCGSDPQKLQGAPSAFKPAVCRFEQEGS